jgi:hypothetical protein
MATRRRFLALLGVGSVSAPLAAKAALDTSIATEMGLGLNYGFGGNAAVLAFGQGGVAPNEATPSIPYQERLIRSSDFVRLAGLPEVTRRQLRDGAKNVFSLDPDISCKRSWSMSVKVMTQRQRNYERSIQRIHDSAWNQRKLDVLKSALGFEWPWG